MNMSINIWHAGENGGRLNRSCCLLLHEEFPLRSIPLSRKSYGSSIIQVQAVPQCGSRHKPVPLKSMEGFICDGDDEEGSKATWWDAMAAFYDDPCFVYGTPLADLNPGPLARGPHPLNRKPSPASAPAPTPNPVSPVSVVSESTPNTILWASGALKLLGIWTCDLEDEFEGLICVRVKSQ